jgi:shikimate dehydrogenase
MILFGLIGYPLSHSWSEAFFTEKFRRENLRDRRYELFPLKDLFSFRSFLASYPELRGLNVTIPYKVKIIPYLDELDEKAIAIGAVNTISIDRRGSSVFLKGFNTDADAFRLSADFGEHKSALILGTGGAAKAVAFVLALLGIQFLFVSRNPVSPGHLNYSEITPDILRMHTLIVNCTPVGMFPDVLSFPEIPYAYLTPHHFLYDLVYNPEMTGFLFKGSEQGCRIFNGIRMLTLQAELSYSIWTAP